jgi:hypothetical protein
MLQHHAALSFVTDSNTLANYTFDAASRLMTHTHLGVFDICCGFMLYYGSIPFHNPGLKNLACPADSNAKIPVMKQGAEGTIIPGASTEAKHADPTGVCLPVLLNPGTV